MDMRAEISARSRFALLEDQTQRRQGQSIAEAATQFDLKRAWERLRRRLAIIVISVAVGGSLSLLVAGTQVPRCRG
jgi:uncharacterized protein involved in exopolysaccharide biosynthesis